MTSEGVLAIDQLRSTVAALDGDMSVRPLSRPSSLIILDNLIEDRRLA